VIIEARTGSSRLPNKVVAEIEGKPMIFYVIDRIKQIKSVEQIILATTQEENDKILTEIAKQNSIGSFVGDSIDVLDRGYQCALQNNADPIIRITGDCPLIDPDIVEEMLEFYLKNNYDYVSNRINPKYPDGLDVEIYSFNTLQMAAQNAKWSSERELVTTYITKNPKNFKIFSYENQEDLSEYRWTVDEQKDLEFIRKIYSIMKPKTNFSMKEIVEILSKNSELLKINAGIMRNEGHLKLYDNDKVVK
jgi:spore coat polysaccharide biosynthesis protein SpsF (cytidylyltransferase family)|tara:strand:- start:337 stop:1083 length:747 start_codon:yes stop_codon:yes gene_type:complete